MKLGITVTLKVHAVMFHIIEFCLMTGRELGPWSEETGKSVHHDFKEIWKRYKVNKVDCSIYGENLLKAVSVYNSQHIRSSITNGSTAYVQYLIFHKFYL